MNQFRGGFSVVELILSSSFEVKDSISSHKRWASSDVPAILKSGSYTRKTGIPALQTGGMEL